MAYRNVYCILPLYFSGTRSTKMDEDVVDWRSLIEMMISFQMKTLDTSYPFKNLFSFFQFLTFCVIWTSHKATKGWHVTFGASVRCIASGHEFHYFYNLSFLFFKAFIDILIHFVGLKNKQITLINCIFPRHQAKFDPYYMDHIQMWNTW